ncbi:calcium-binding protein [Pseudonocardia abyssalis]|uniref:Hemolysin type calcium-binding protein n=1 Tax=Pseudonocardia abyssalis TaxID=2792008 RepID=A0ABS6UM43_9PSEU|nr:calcium-binding protein [Pseudonocardia abyssalis]MBW0114637.1 hypothetical protein [Pseudonocardia abyssalis]MBW0132973.1 hypothetical protein [Pseudonocardia abyssalis]
MLSTRARTGLITTAVAALLLVPATAAQAATTVVVTPEDLKGWSIAPAPNDTTTAFQAGPSTSGAGAVRFGPIAASPAASKFIIQRVATSPTATLGLAVDYYIDPAAGNKAPEQYYVNVYVDSAQDATPPASFYECRYDYVATVGGDGWHTLTLGPSTTATAVQTREGLTCGDSLDDLPAGGTAFLLALNAGDTSANDAGIAGGFDTVRISSAGLTTTYDFEPVPVTACDTAPTPGRTGTAGADVLRGTAGADRVDLLAGNDTADLLGGNDCVLGGAGRDVLRSGDGGDEVLGGADADTIDTGAGADVVDPGAGRDTVSAGAGDDEVSAVDGEVDVVDCGGGVDTVRADSADVLRNCETRL